MSNKSWSLIPDGDGGFLIEVGKHGGSVWLATPEEAHDFVSKYNISNGDTVLKDIADWRVHPEWALIRIGVVIRPNGKNYLRTFEAFTDDDISAIQDALKRKNAKDNITQD